MSSDKPDDQPHSSGYTEVFAWGADRYGQLGLGGGRSYAVPRFCTFNVVIRHVSCGEQHSAFISGDGTIFTMGSNADGRLGIGDRTVKTSSTPCLVEALSRFKSATVACGWGHTAAVTDSGDLYTWGVGEFGALGINDCLSQWLPVKVRFSQSDRVIIKAVSCGTRHTAIVDTKGRLFACGAGDAGQLGTGTREQHTAPMQVEAVKDPVVQTACGIFHTLVLTAAGKVIAMGGNNFGQLGTGDKRSSVVPVAVRVLGEEKVVKVAAGHFSAALTNTGKVYVWGTGVFGEYLEPKMLSGIRTPIMDIDVGSDSGAAVDSAGALYSWGANASGELGLGDYEARTAASQVGALRGRTVTQVACGGSFIIALGRTVSHKYVPEKGKADTEEKKIERQEQPRTGRTKEPREEAKNINNELLDAYKAEQQNCKSLAQRVIDLRSQALESQAAVDTRLQELDQQFAAKINAAEQHLVAEREKSSGLEQELAGENKRESALAQRQAELDSRRQELEREVEITQEENRRVRSDRAAQRAGESTRLGEVLRDYEGQIEGVIAERRRVAREKGEEIAAIHEEISRVQNVILSMQTDKAMFGERSKGEISRLEATLSELKNELSTKEAGRDQMLSQQESDTNSNAHLTEEAAAANTQIAELEDEVKRLISEIENRKRELLDREQSLEAATKDCSELMSVAHDKEVQHSRYLAAIRDQEETQKIECEKFRAALREKESANANLQKTVALKAEEIANLTQEVNAWTELADRTRGENTELKKSIEGLEAKNKGLLETMNLHMYNRAAEYKERTIKALQTTSPIGKGRTNSGQKGKRVAPSPERLEKFLEEEKKTTKTGVSAIGQLTQFQADTTSNIKHATKGENQNRTKQFDGRLVTDREDYKVEEDPRYVRSNYALIQMMDSYDRHPERSMRVDSVAPLERTLATPKRTVDESALHTQARTEARGERNRAPVETPAARSRAEDAYVTPYAGKRTGEKSSAGITPSTAVQPGRLSAGPAADVVDTL